MRLFISGWAGFKEALGDIPEDWYFINPFLDLDEEGILDFLKYKSGEIITGWSTGGHIILKNLQFFSERFHKIVIIAGFKNFTDYVNPRVIRRMIQKMHTEPYTVIKEFLINSGCRPILPDILDNNPLIKGLKFLLSSDINLKRLEFPLNLALIHGKRDKIVPFQALYDLNLKDAQTYLIDGDHWVTFKEVERILENI